MGRFLQNSKAEGARPAFNRVRRTKMAFSCSNPEIQGPNQAGAAPCQPTVRQLHQKGLIKIANIHAHAITSDWLVAMWERLPAERPLAVVRHLPAHSGFQRFHAKWPLPPAYSAPADLYGG